MNKRLSIGFFILSFAGSAIASGPPAPAPTNPAPPHMPTMGAPPQKPTANAPSATVAAVPSSLEPIGAYAGYNYYGDRYRDPFIPLVGEVRNDQSLDRPPPVSSLILKGIVGDANGRMALLTSGVSSYILKGGRLYDGRNKMVKKISGVIKPDSVIIIGSDRTVRELRTKATL